MTRPPANTGSLAKLATSKPEAGLLGNMWETAHPRRSTLMIQGTSFFMQSRVA
jgi:hypothetical protein